MHARCLHASVATSRNRHFCWSLQPTLPPQRTLRVASLHCTALHAVQEDSMQTATVYSVVYDVVEEAQPQRPTLRTADGNPRKMWSWKHPGQKCRWSSYPHTHTVNKPTLHPHHFRAAITTSEIPSVKGTMMQELEIHTLYFQHCTTWLQSEGCTRPCAV